MPPVQETSIGEQLKSLIRLQHIDTQIDHVEKLRGDLPDEIRDLEDERAGLETRIQKYKQEQEENEAARLQADRDIKEAEGLIKKYEEQQLQGRNNRENDALTKQIEAQKQRIVDSQAKVEEDESGREAQTTHVSETEERLKELNEALEAKQKELQEVLEDTRQEQSELEEKRAAAEAEVDTRYLRAYKLLRNRLRDGRVVV